MTSHSAQNTPTPSDDSQSKKLPLMLTQAILVAAVLCIAEIICSPIYVGMSQEPLFPIGTWALIACLFAVMFSYVVGFALLWCCESFAYRMKRKVQPLVYAVIGAIGFGVWTTWVVMAIMKSVLNAYNIALVSGASTTATINGALLGLASFFVAATLGELASKYRKTMIAIGIITLLLACGGGYILFSIAHA